MQWSKTDLNFFQLIMRVGSVQLVINETLIDHKLEINNNLYCIFEKVIQILIMHWAIT